MLFLSSNEAEQKRQVRESRRRSDRRLQKRRAAAFRSILTVFAALVLVASVWSLRRFRKSWTSDLVEPRLGQSTSDAAKVVSAMKLAKETRNHDIASQGIKEAHSDLRVSRENENKPAQPILPKRSDSSQNQVGGNLPRKLGDDKGQHYAVNQKTGARATKKVVDTSTPHQAPGLLAPAEEKQPSGEEDGDTASERNLEDGKNHSRQADAVSQQNRNEMSNEENVVQDSKEAEGGESESLGNDEEDESDENEFDDILSEEEGGRAPIITLGQKRNRAEEEDASG